MNTDVNDRCLRDIWEALVLTGRRCSEVLKLRLDCVGRYHGRLPMLWHDQTKVGNYNEGIRIPERLYTSLDKRRRTTLERFELRNGRQPTAEERTGMALFPTEVRNRGERRSISHTFFHLQFKSWVDSLDLGKCVPHQARHTLATKLLSNGASLAHIRRYLGQVSDRMAEHYAKVADSEIETVLQAVWVSGPGAARPGELLTGTEPLSREQATALALDLSRRSTPAEGGFCTFQPVVNGDACPWKLNCEGCDKFVLSGADLLYWRRKQEQWRSIAERAPDDATADYLHQVFEPTARAIDGLERALAGLGLLEDALALDLRRPQDFYHRLPDQRPRRPRQRRRLHIHHRGAMSTKPHQRTAAAIASRRQTAEAMLDRVREALARMERSRAPITVAAVARQADVSRAFLYQNSQAKDLIAQASTRSGVGREQDREDADARLTASWRERALNAEDGLKTALGEVRTQRDRIGELLGRIRDLEQDLPKDAVQRVMTENTALKRQIQQLTGERRGLEDRLKGARENNRFLDKRVAELEAQLAELLTQRGVLDLP